MKIVRVRKVDASLYDENVFHGFLKDIEKGLKGIENQWKKVKANLPNHPGFKSTADNITSEVRDFFGKFIDINLDLVRLKDKVKWLCNDIETFNKFNK